MQWLLQDFEDMGKLARILERTGSRYSWHKVVPFIGTLSPEPDIDNRDAVLLFGSYTLWRYAEANGLRPGMFKIRPFVREASWHPYLLNGPGARFLKLQDIPSAIKDGDTWFIRPVADSKEVAGQVRSGQDLREMARKVCALPEEELPPGSLRPDTDVMLSPPVRIQKEWRLWVVADRIVTWSLYREGHRVVYRHDIDEDALAFARNLITCNPGYAPAYVMDICRTPARLALLETNCINAAGFYAADLTRLVPALENLPPAMA